MLKIKIKSFDFFVDFCVLFEQTRRYLIDALLGAKRLLVAQIDRALDRRLGNNERKWSTLELPGVSIDFQLQLDFCDTVQQAKARHAAVKW